MRALTDGKTHKRLPDTEALQFDTTNTSTIKLFTDKMAAPIMIFPTTTTVKKFCGSQSDKSARELTSLYEAVI